MAKFIAMLRGVNVGGNVLKMDRLRNLCENAGFTHVQTYVQSGNIIFGSDRPASTLSAMIEKCLKGETRLPVSVLVRSRAELKKAVMDNPFLKERGIDPSKLHVTFLAEKGGKDGTQMLSAITAGADRFHIAGKEIYLHCPVSYGETKLSNNAIQKALGITATTRNWKTVNTLLEMSA
jgi:uncharacterized protein (DUF1697 family)